MNFDKGHNVFSDIPGFDASRGERIVKALQKLWKKIEYLEQIRISERKSKSKEVLASSRDEDQGLADSLERKAKLSSKQNNEDLTVTDVQYKLLLLQLQYVRSLLRQKLDKHSIISHSKNIDGGKISDNNDPSNTEDFYHKGVSQETQTGSSLIEGWNPSSQDTIDSQVLKSGRPIDCSSITAKIPPSTSKPHYHLKLNDVPFILGASSTASHSVVANVQNIIAMMKSHNKALCGPKQHVSRLPARTNFASANLQDATNTLNELSQDLYELSLKQEKLAKRFDLVQGKNHDSNSTKDFEVNNRSRVNKPVSTRNIKRCRSNSESSIKLQAEVKNFPTIKEKDSDYSTKQKIRSLPSNPPIMARRKLLQSLKNFKSHLSEEDISWD